MSDHSTDGADDRRPCTECRRFIGHACTDAKRAMLGGGRAQRVEIAPEFAATPQRCPAFVARHAASAGAQA